MYSLSPKQKYKNVAFYDLTFPTLHSGPSIFIMTVTLHVSKLSNQTTYVDIMLMLYFIITVRNKVAKVMFLHLSVILFTGGMVCLSACWDTTPREAHPPRKCTHPPPQKHTLPGSTPPGSTPPGNHPLPQGSTPPRKDPPPLGKHTPQEGSPPPRETAAAADGTHPTGMHCCFVYRNGHYFIKTTNYSLEFSIRELILPSRIVWSYLVPTLFRISWF